MGMTKAAHAGSSCSHYCILHIVEVWHHLFSVEHHGNGVQQVGEAQISYAYQGASHGRVVDGGNHGNHFRQNGAHFGSGCLKFGVHKHKIQITLSKPELLQVQWLQAPEQQKLLD